MAWLRPTNKSSTARRGQASTGTGSSGRQEQPAPQGLQRRRAPGRAALHSSSHAASSPATSAALLPLQPYMVTGHALRGPSVQRPRQAPLQSGTITAGLRLVAFAAWGSRRVQGTLGVLQLLPAACMQQRYIARPRRLPARAHLKPPHTPRVIMAARCSPGGLPCLRGARMAAGDVPSARVSAGLCCLHRREPASGVCDCVRQ
jgi:hypothetical protein